MGTERISHWNLKKLNYRYQKLETTKLINCFYCRVKHLNYLNKTFFTIRSLTIAAIYLINKQMRYGYSDFDY